MQSQFWFLCLMLIFLIRLTGRFSYFVVVGEQNIAGYINISWPIVTNITVSIYDKLRTRNRCNHRDYQNLGVNGRCPHSLSNWLMLLLMSACDLDFIAGTWSIIKWFNGFCAYHQMGSKGTALRGWVQDQTLMDRLFTFCSNRTSGLRKPSAAILPPLGSRPNLDYLEIIAG